AVCLDDRAGADGAFAEALAEWYGHRIRKVARRARNKAWDDVQALPGVTVNNQAQAFAPSALQDVHPLLARLQIGHTDIAPEEVGTPRSDAPVIYVDNTLEMTAGKAAAQVGHGSMLYAASLTAEQAWQWAQEEYALSVREVPREVFNQALSQPDAEVIRDAGYTEVAPDSATVGTVSAPLPYTLSLRAPQPLERTANGVGVGGGPKLRHRPFEETAVAFGLNPVVQYGHNAAIRRGAQEPAGTLSHEQGSVGGRDFHKALAPGGIGCFRARLQQWLIRAGERDAVN